MEDKNQENMERGNEKRRNFLRLEIEDGDNEADRKKKESRSGNEKLSRLRWWVERKQGDDRGLRGSGGRLCKRDRSNLGGAGGRGSRGGGLVFPGLHHDSGNWSGW